MNSRTIYSLSGSIPIGYAGENKSRKVAIDICQLVRQWPDLTPRLLAKRPGESDPYPCRTQQEGGVLIWEVTDSDTAIAGMGECVVHMVNDEGVVGKSRVARTIIKDTIDGAMQDNPPEAARPWVDEVLDAAKRAEAAADRAENVEGGANEEAVREIVEEALTEAKESGEFDGPPGAPGKDGYTPVKGVDYFDGEPGYTPIKGVDYFDGEKGEPGQDGYTPIKGVDYFDGKDGAPGAPGEAGYTPQKGVDYFDGKDGEPGADGKPGYSPTITLTRMTDGVKIDVQNEDGTQSATVYDGKDGENAEGGAALDVIDDEDVLFALAENDLMLAVGSEGGVLCDEAGNVLEW